MPNTQVSLGEARRVARGGGSLVENATFPDGVAVRFRPWCIPGCPNTLFAIHLRGNSYVEVCEGQFATRQREFARKQRELCSKALAGSRVRSGCCCHTSQRFRNFEGFSGPGLQKRNPAFCVKSHEQFSVLFNRIFVHELLVFVFIGVLFLRENVVYLNHRVSEKRDR